MKGMIRKGYNIWNRDDDTSPPTDYLASIQAIFLSSDELIPQMEDYTDTIPTEVSPETLEGVLRRAPRQSSRDYQLYVTTTCWCLLGQVAM